MSILEHHFPPLIAEKYGVNAAILLRDFYHWCETNRNNGDNYYEGRWWTYQTLKGLCSRHTYWSKNQVEHIIRTCREKGALLTGHFGQDQFDRTCWYALTDEALALFEGPALISEKSEIDSGESPASISEKSEMDFGKDTPTNRKNQKCYIDKYKTENKADTPYSPPEGEGAPPVKKKRSRREPPKKAPDWKPERFAGFWAYYPRGEDKQLAIREWDKLKPSDELIDKMAQALQRQMASEDWQAGVGIPYAGRWLRNRRWKDEKIRMADGEDPPDEPLRGEGVEYL